MFLGYRSVQPSFSHRRERSARVSCIDPGGFTLVEMLISVALVLIMMTMFAQVFQMAGGSISTMRGLAENDQRSRTLQTLLKADLDKRTLRWVYPFAGNEDPNAVESNVSNRQGFFYISENDPFNTLDDILHFTMSSTIVAFNTDTTPYYGQAFTFPDPNFAATIQSPFINIPNQPDADDAQLTPNNTGQSTAAEVCYFVRNGNLYRRQLLLRQPLSITSSIQPDSGVSTPPIPVNLFAPNFAVLTGLGAPGYVWQIANNPNSYGTYYGDFDYSATFGGALVGAKFLSGLDALNNTGTSVISVIANPTCRFGFAPVASGGTNQGRPKEFASDPGAGAGNFMTCIGRYTLQECSDPNFQYPQALATTSGLIPTDPGYTITAFDPTTGAVTAPDDLAEGFRRGEDLVLSNVHAFDIQVWDQAFGGFINIGDPNATSDYSLGNRNGALSSSFGPRVVEQSVNGGIWVGAINAVFDTWHPNIPVAYDGNALVGTLDAFGNTIAEAPPYRPVLFKPGSIGDWSPGVSTATLHAAGQPLYVFPSGPPGTYIGTPTTPAKAPYGFPFVYRCLIDGTTNSNGGSLTDYSVEPQWPKADGMTVQDGTVLWECIDNRKPLKAIKITIRFVDTSTQQMRQVTIIQSLVD